MQFPLKLHIKKILTDALRTLISLKTIFINILWENDKSINFFDFFFYISNEICVKTFIVLKIVLKTLINMT